MANTALCQPQERRRENTDYLDHALEFTERSCSNIATDHGQM